MGVHDDDILDFDYVDDVTREAPPPTRSGAPRSPYGAGDSPQGPRQRPQLRAPHGVTPLLRLLGLVAFAIALVVILAVWAQGCLEKDTAARTTAYYEEIGAVGAASTKIGKDLATLLTTPGLEQATLETRLGGIVQRQQIGVDRAVAIDAPGALTPAHEAAVEALQFRVDGLQGMLDAFKATKDTDDSSAAGAQIAAAAARLEASDVIWADLFQGAADDVAAAAGVDGAAPASAVVSNADLLTPESLAAIWQRVHGASTGGSTASGTHGTNIEAVKATPSETQLSVNTETTLTVQTDLGFEVSILNGGESQEVAIEVTLTIPKQPSPIVKKATIDVIDPGETKVVVFEDFPDVPFGEGTTVQVSVKPVPGETNTGNNSYEYPVVFTLGQ